jgi:hypothetical protein
MRTRLIIFKTSKCPYSDAYEQVNIFKTQHIFPTHFNTYKLPLVVAMKHKNADTILQKILE